MRHIFSIVCIGLIIWLASDKIAATSGGDGQGRRSHDAERKRDGVQLLEQLPGAAERNRGLRRVGALLQSLHSRL
jgi:hypothetical protein